jgi:hypothetical protein
MSGKPGFFAEFIEGCPYLTRLFALLRVTIEEAHEEIPDAGFNLCALCGFV